MDVTKTEQIFRADVALRKQIRTLVQFFSGSFAGGMRTVNVLRAEIQQAFVKADV